MGTPTSRMLTMGYRVTALVTASQKPCSPGCGGFRENRARKGTVSMPTLGPSSASTAGRSVSVAASAASTTRIAPMASDW